jgi:hypothetical protein
MDAFVTFICEKKEKKKTIHQKEMNLLKKYLDEKHNVFICGPHGSGKSFILHEIIDDNKLVEITNTKNITQTNSILFIDNYENQPLGEKISNGSLVVMSNKVYILPNFKTIIMPKHTPQEIATLSDDHNAFECAVRCEGNIQNFFHYLEGSDDKDIFKNPKEIFREILCSENSIKLYENLQEHGHIWDVIHSNYLSTNPINYAEIAHSMSNADICDSQLYVNDWDFMPYFAVSAISIPKQHMSKILNQDDIKAGSCWTKYGNYKMRLNKLNEIKKLNNPPLGIEELYLIRLYGEKGNYDILKEYNLKSQHMDVINHLCIGNKLNQNKLSIIKKNLSKSI